MSKDWEYCCVATSVGDFYEAPVLHDSFQDAPPIALKILMEFVPPEKKSYEQILYDGVTAGARMNSFLLTASQPDLL